MILGHQIWYRALMLCLSFMTTNANGADWLSRVPTDGPDNVLRLPDDQTFYFLRFGQHSFEPDQLVGDDAQAVAVEKGRPILLAPFQQLYAIAWKVQDVKPGAMLRATRAIRRDAFWDQTIRVDAAAVSAAPRETLVETGIFGSALPQCFPTSRAMRFGERIKESVFPLKFHYNWGPNIISNASRHSHQQRIG